MTVFWLTAFIDLPAHTAQAGTEFWRAVTGTIESAPRGDAQEFLTLVPDEGDAYIKVQRTGDDMPRIHLDLHVHDVARARDLAEELGATVRFDDLGYVTLDSPSGFTFCLVDHAVDGVLPPVRTDPVPHRLDQVCIDLPATQFDQECRFWAALTGWALRSSTFAEFASLERPAGIPLRLLLQRLGEDDPATTSRAHLDLSAAEERERLADTHVALGATRIRDFANWIVMRDPAGMEYCLTRRDPYHAEVS